MNPGGEFSKDSAENSPFFVRTVKSCIKLKISYNGFIRLTCREEQELPEQRGREAGESGA